MSDASVPSKKQLPSNYPTVDRALEIVRQGDDAPAWAMYQSAEVLSAEVERLQRERDELRVWMGKAERFKRDQWERIAPVQRNQPGSYDRGYQNGMADILRGLTEAMTWPPGRPADGPDVDLGVQDDACGSDIECPTCGQWHAEKAADELRRKLERRSDEIAGQRSGVLPRTGAYAPSATCKHGVHPYDCRQGCDPHTMEAYTRDKVRKLRDFILAAPWFDPRTMACRDAIDVAIERLSVETSAP